MKKEKNASSDSLLVHLSTAWPLLPLVTPMLVSLLVALLSHAEAETCSVSTRDNYPQQVHYFFYRDSDHPIIIEDSNRVSHQIANRILKILLESIAGYQNVKIDHCYFYDNHNITALLDRVSGKTYSKHCQPPTINHNEIPATMVNLEAWMVAGFDKGPWLNTGQLVDAGPLGPQGRMGWFLPKFIVDKNWENEKKILDHWKALSTKLVKNLSWWGRRELEEIKPDYEQDAYKNPKCLDVKGKRPSCATLFAANKGVDAGLLEEQIKALDINVDIVWLDDKLHQFVVEQLNNSQPVLFFNWHPDTLIASGQFTRVNFPETHASHKNEPVDCDFPVNQLTKVLWGPLKSDAYEAYHIISQMSFSDMEYDGLIAQHPHFTVDQIACQWINNNSAKWDLWLPNRLREKPKIYLGGLFPMSGKIWSQPGIVEGAKLAVDLVNKDPQTLPNHTLELLVHDTKCEYDVAMNQFITLAQKKLPPIVGILGTGCSDPAERIAALSKHFNMMMVSYGAEAQSLSDREKYPYFFRTVPSVKLYLQIYPSLFKVLAKELGSKMIGAVAESGQELPEYHMTLQERLMADGFTLIVKRQSLNGTQTPDIAQILKEFKTSNVRIIIADVFSNVAREIFCEAFKQKMTAFEGYVWFLPSWYAQDWKNVDYYNGEPNNHEIYPHRENVPCKTSEVEHAAEGHFVLSKSFLAPPGTVVAGGITVDEYKMKYAKKCGTSVEESNFASFAYDAVWVYAKSLDALLRENRAALETIHTKKTASAFRHAIASIHFSGVSGLVKFDGSDRNGDILILQEFSNETRTVGKYSSGVEFDAMPNLILALKNISLLYTSPKESQGETKDECMIESFREKLGVSCTIAVIIMTVIIFFGFVIIAIIIPIAMKYRCDAKLKKFKATHERIKELGLLKKEFYPILSVDVWELPRKDVVLNRILGEGAFGTVMGGELKKGRDWVAVAVKTLKLDHTIEEKLDFFREVDMMKSFKHENIVQLMGVCTRKEPIYAVMEFLLHGDLKTYLLSRRDLVGQCIKEAEDVKAERLTQMAVDVAKGLSFLHSLKYVHRDIACRNCLVHAKKTVKISDFGMTRHTSSTDYYRFCRKAMLPVRWTAPEALKDGIYSAKSDIWSFGVLVFEIVTFGSFPYQGLSNSEVLDYVIKGNLLSLPEKCPAELKSFIRWCMSNDPGYRPDLVDILSYLNYSPAFLIPCLDAPMTSIIHDDSNSLELQTSKSDKIKDKKRTFSVPGLSSLAKVGKSSSSAKSPISSSMSSSICSGMLHNSSVCSLNSFGNVVGLLDINDLKDEDISFKKHSGDIYRHSLKSYRDVETEIRKMEARKSVSSDRRFSSTAGSDRGDLSSGYISQISKGESKHICQTVTSL
ncbi:venus kinase receptor [Biomphalaria pfeifferi]|uniref:receptor protein-tyrosine kinase n=1 Tax=Biomphalaria pfeifferi TaxID=112525 RepID=A0AAD8FFR7_BIOPF|nr:venus kinase receptor [Biomphalaria pfeifferi]